MSIAACIFNPKIDLVNKQFLDFNAKYVDVLSSSTLTWKELVDDEGVYQLVPEITVCYK